MQTSLVPIASQQRKLLPLCKQLVYKVSPQKLNRFRAISECLLAVRKNRYVILPVDFEEAWKVRCLVLFVPINPSGISKRLTRLFPSHHQQTVKRTDDTHDFCTSPSVGLCYNFLIFFFSRPVVCLGDSLSVSTLSSCFCERRTDVSMQYSACILVDNRRCPKSRACSHGLEPSSFHFSVPPLPHGWAPILVSEMKVIFDTSGAIFASLFMLSLVGTAHMKKVVHTPETNVSVVHGLYYVSAMVRPILRCLRLII